MAQKRTTQEVIQSISSLISDFTRPADRGKWFSVIERPLGAFLKTHKVNTRYSPFIFQALSERGVLEKEGKMSGLRYRVEQKLNFNPDTLAELVVDLEKKNKATGGYDPSDKSDLRPLSSKGSYIPKKLSGKPTPIPRKHLCLGDTQYAIIDSEIHEGVVVSLSVDLKDLTSINPKLLSVTLLYKDSDGIRDVKDFPRNKLFDSAEDLAAYLVQKRVKF